MYCPGADWRLKPHSNYFRKVHIKRFLTFENDITFSLLLTCFVFKKKGSVQINEEINHVKHKDLSKQSNAEEKRKKNRAKEHRHSEKAVRILKEWLMKNAKEPYPTSNDRAKLSLLTELTPT